MTTAGDITALIHGNNLYQVHSRSILIHYNGSLTQQIIEIISLFCKPLQYAIFFPAGILGWSLETPIS